VIAAIRSSRRAPKSVLVAIGLAVVMTSAGLTSGCTSTSTGIDAAVAAGLQGDVVLVGELAASGDTVAALGVLANVEADAEQAGADGSLDAERLAAIRSSIAAVKGDLEAAKAAADQAAADQAAAEQAAADQAAAEQAAADQAAADQAADTQEEPATEQAPTEVDPATETVQPETPAEDGPGADGNKGKGNNNGNGNGNGNGKKK
jgi:hypothetical protein